MAVPDVYMVSVKNVPNIFAALNQAGVPERFGSEFLKQLGFASSNDRAFPGVLKALRFVDDNGVPTERYHRYRDPEVSGAVMAEALRDAYADVFTVKEKAYELSNPNLVGVFKRVGGKTDAVSQKMASTFKALSKLADWNAPSAAPSPEPADDGVVEVGGGHEPGAVESGSGSVPPVVPGLTALHHDIHIHLPVTTDVAVYDAIFRSIKNNLV